MSGEGRGKGRESVMTMGMREKEDDGRKERIYLEVQENL
jgi:hypothetical protein